MFRSEWVVVNGLMVEVLRTKAPIAKLLSILGWRFLRRSGVDGLVTEVMVIGRCKLIILLEFFRASRRLTRAPSASVGKERVMRSCRSVSKCPRGEIRFSASPWEKLAAHGSSVRAMWQTATATRRRSTEMSSCRVNVPLR